MLVTLAIQLPRLVASLAQSHQLAIDISSLVHKRKQLLVCTVNCVHSDLVNRCTCTFHGMHFYVVSMLVAMAWG